MKNTIDIISTNELAQIIHKDNVHIIDIRSVNAYNGWKEQQEPRGGHIKNARSVPFKWFQYIDWLEIIESKQIATDNQIIVYGYDRDKIDKAAAQFKKAGYENIRVYYEFCRDWTKNSSLPMDFMKKYKQLVSAGWLNQLMKSEKAPEYDNNKFVICHAHYQNPSAYDEGHIPGAIEVDTNSLESPETWNRRTPQELKLILEKLGITHDTTVICYGRFSFPDNNDPFPGSSAGHLGSIRAALIMMYAGVRDVRILNGGLQAWLDEGLELTTRETLPNPVTDFGRKIPANPELFIDLPQAKEYLKADNKNLVSVRSWEEYIGNVSGYNYIAKKGRIPGSVFGNCGSDAYHMENYRNLDHTTREYDEIIKQWSSAGINKDKYNAFYCGTGWRGSEAFLNAWLMDWPNISVYDGGWFEWSNDSTNPYETGPLN